ncbi:MAG: hypothetical protein ACLUDY_10710 [Bacteroides xylanisolvens]
MGESDSWVFSQLVYTTECGPWKRMLLIDSSSPDRAGNPHYKDNPLPAKEY